MLDLLIDKEVLSLGLTFEPLVNKAQFSRTPICGSKIAGPDADDKTRGWMNVHLDRQPGRGK
jgi:hypothetical protein